MLDLVFRNIWQRKTRSILTALGIASVLTLYLWSAAITTWYDHDLQQQLSGMAGKVMVRAKSEDQSLYALSVIPQSDAEALLSLDGVDAVRSTLVLLEALMANPAPGMPPLVQAVGLRPGKETAFRGDAKVQGASTLTGADDVILGAGAALKYAKAVGDEMQLQNHTFKVVGVMEPIQQVVDSAVIMNLATAQQVFIRPGVVTQVYLVAKQADQAEAVVKAVQAANPRLEALGAAGMARTASTMLEAMRGFFGKIKDAGIIMALIVIVIVMNMAVSERKREIGTLKAIGASARTVVGMVVAEAVILSLAGALLALPAAWLTLMADHQSVSLALATQALLFACVVGAAAAVWPAWNAVRVDPLESLRYE